MSWRSSRDYRLWRVAVIRRDKVCKCCGDRKRRHAHHIRHATYYPELRFDVNNGIALCSDCHMILHNKFAGGYRRKCDERHLSRLFYVADYFEERDKKLNQ